MTDLDWTSRFDGLSKLDPKTRDYLTANSKDHDLWARQITTKHAILA